MLGSLSHDEKLRLLAAADVFVFPSTEITEAFGVSQLEAMVVGCPVVATNLPTGVTDVSVDGRTALVVEPNDAEALAAAIGRVCDDRVLAERLASNARRRVQQNFTIKKMVERNATLIAQVLFESPDAMSGGCIKQPPSTAVFDKGE